MQSEQLTFREAWIRASSLLKQAETKDAKFEAELLLRHAASMERHQLFLQLDEPLPEHLERVYFQSIDKRCSHMPVQYILGRQEFYGRDFYVDERVLIPRPETELLIEQALKRVEDEARILDIGTGSGAIAVTLALESRDKCKNVSVYAVDISDSALQVAKENAKRFMAEKVHFCLADIWPSGVLQGDFAFDIIVSNPPYIDKSDWQQMDREVKEYEPEIALFAPEQGLAFYRRIISEARGKLRSGGWLGFEMGFQQAAAIKDMFHQCGYEQISVYEDLAGHARVMFAKMT